MPISTVSPIELASPGDDEAIGNVHGPNAESASPSDSAFEFPAFGGSSALYEATSRRAGRINASAVSEQELSSLLAERQALLDLKFDGTISNTQMNRLTYVGWSLDRIEDAKYGEEFDEFEDHLLRYEKFSTDLRSLTDALLKRTQGRRA